MKEPPQIFAFYSFKGGVGRSMAVLNLAYALAAKGRHVLVLDMDLEAPGLSGFLHREREIGGFAQFDMVDLVSWASMASLPLDPLSFHPFTDYVIPIARENLERIPSDFSKFGRLDIIPVDEERAYYDRLSTLAMEYYDQEALVRTGSVLRAWLKSLRFPIEVA
jgi:cellulose biosynthesis protein BcsQ